MSLFVMSQFVLRWRRLKSKESKRFLIFQFQKSKPSRVNLGVNLHRPTPVDRLGRTDDKGDCLQLKKRGSEESVIMTYASPASSVLAALST